MRGNPVVPNAPVPSQVRMSTLPTPPDPVAKVDVDGIPISVDEGVEEIASPTPQEFEENLSKRLEEEADGKPKGTILIKVYENMPYEVDFAGRVTGTEVDMAWKAMMKQYRVWKHTLFNKAKLESGGV